MKKLFVIYVFILLTINAFGQLPQKFSYQAVIRNVDGDLVKSQQVGIRINILQGSTSGTLIYNEVQTPQTNQNGLISIEIGTGLGFDAINWSNGPYFIKTEVAVEPPLDTYTIEGNSQILSVPYALHSKSADTIIGNINEIDPTVSSHIKSITTDNISNWNNAYSWGNHQLVGYIEEELQVLSISNDTVFLTGGSFVKLPSAPDLSIYATKNMNDENITNLAEPVNPKDAVTKSYVDSLELAVNDLTLRVEDLEVGVVSSLPSVTTDTINNITSITAVVLGNVTDDGGGLVSARGVVYSKNSNPTIENNEGITIEGSGVGQFTSYLTALSHNSTYYVRAYATNKKGTAYGLEKVFNTKKIILDADGNEYTSVAIGTQEWLVENLKTTKFNDGTPIYYMPLNNDFTNTTLPAYCWYNNDASNKNIYGAIYNAYTASPDIGSVKNPCPIEWQVPTTTEWSILVNYLGGETVSGGKLKSNRTHPDEHPRWDYPNTDATNEVGFSALPGGKRSQYNGAYIELGLNGYFWTSYGSGSNGIYRIFSFDNASINGFVIDAKAGFSIRCIKN